MICPNCGESCPEHHKFCGVCGGALPAVSAPEAPVCAPTEDAVTRQNDPSKGRLWPPIAIMGGLTVLGLLLFYFI